MTFEAMTTDERWLGFGYLGERKNFLTHSDMEEREAHVAEVDAMVLAHTKRWNAEQLFRWANSKNGRWFGETVLGDVDRFAHAVKVGLLVLPPSR